MTSGMKRGRCSLWLILRRLIQIDYFRRHCRCCRRLLQQQRRHRNLAFVGQSARRRRRVETLADNEHDERLDVRLIGARDFWR